MLSSESKELVSDIVTLFVQATRIPIGVYEIDDDGNVLEIVRADERLSAPQKVDPLVCRAGLTSLTEPILINGRPVAVVEYGSFRSPDEDDSITSSTLEWTRRILPQSIQRIIYGYVSEKENTARAQRSAYHDLQIRLQAAVAHAENMLDEISMKAPSRDTAVDLISALEAISMVMHGLTQGEYLPDYRFKPFTVRHFIDQAVRLCRAEAAQKHVKIAIDLLPQNGNMVIQASEPHLQQAFNNLLHNAVKYSYRATESTQRYVSVRGHLVHNGYEVAITNYGVGIELDEYNYIFQEGYRGRLTIEEYRTGSGQGLILVKRVIESHHGRITVTSQALGDGAAYLTSFTVFLPLEQPKERQT